MFPNMVYFGFIGSFFFPFYAAYDEEFYYLFKMFYYHRVYQAKFLCLLQQELWI